MKQTVYLIFFLVIYTFCDPPTPFWGGNPVWTTKIRVISKNATGEAMNMTATYYYNWNVKG